MLLFERTRSTHATGNQCPSLSPSLPPSHLISTQTSVRPRRPHRTGRRRLSCLRASESNRAEESGERGAKRDRPTDHPSPSSLPLALGRLCIIVSSNIHPIRKREFRLRHHPIFNPSVHGPWSCCCIGFVAIAEEEEAIAVAHNMESAPGQSRCPSLPCSIRASSNERSRPCFCRTHRTRREGRNFSHCTLLKKVFMSYNARATADCTALPLPPFDGWLIPCLPT